MLSLLTAALQLNSTFYHDTTDYIHSRKDIIWAETISVNEALSLISITQGRFDMSKFNTFQNLLLEKHKELTDTDRYEQQWST